MVLSANEVYMKLSESCSQWCLSKSCLLRFTLLNRHFCPTKPPLHLIRGQNKTWQTCSSRLSSVPKNLCIIVLGVLFASSFRWQGIVKTPDIFMVTQEAESYWIIKRDITLLFRKSIFKPNWQHLQLLGKINMLIWHFGQELDCNAPICHTIAIVHSWELLPVKRL